jgi:effector-binding domain-containing protein
MIDAPRIVQTAAVPMAFIPLTVPRSQIQSVMGPGLGEVMAALRAQGITPAGPWFTHHLRMDPGFFDFEICVPVSSPVRAAGRVQPGTLAAATVARTIHHGPYEGLGAAWQALRDWVAAGGRKAAPSLWEVYLTDPGASPDPASWRTELNQPLLEG